MMAQSSLESVRISIIGLGYVGLPLALHLARHFPVVGFDVDEARISELRSGKDNTGEVLSSELRGTSVHFSDDRQDIEDANLFIVTVPTPIDADNEPDLRAIEAACRLVGSVLNNGSVVVFESTVYPGVTEDICGPILEAESGQKCGRDFFLGYSPERMNPGDREHSVDKITKVVAGQTPEVANLLEQVYGEVTNGNIFVADNIRTAEAAKVIENAQRDINIAFVNEVSMIFDKLGINTHSVLAAARTKWNFLNFEPGLVGGHCISVDPFYLAHVARQFGHEPEVILAGRRINDGMAEFMAEGVARNIGKLLETSTPPRVLVLGITFKENVPDIRNSKSVDLINALVRRGYQVDAHDAMADAEETKRHYGIDLLANLDGVSGYDCVVGAVPHGVYRAFNSRVLVSLLAQGGLLADLKGMWREIDLGDSYSRWEV